MDDPFDSIVDGLELEEPRYYIDVTKLDVEELLTQFDELNDELFEMGEALRPTTQRSRDLHSLRSAIYLEIQKRGKK
jgi:hypothetical protein